MNKKTVGICSGIGGSILASIAVFLIVKKKKNKKAASSEEQEEEKVEETTEEDSHAEEPIVEHEPKTPVMEKAKSIIKEELYSKEDDDDDGSENYTSHEFGGLEGGPHIIEARSYGELDSEGYTSVVWKYYESGEVTDEDNDVVSTEDVDRYIGWDLISELGDDTEEDTYVDSIYVRNDFLQMDFQIEFIPGEYDEYDD